MQLSIRSEKRKNFRPSFTHNWDANWTNYRFYRTWKNDFDFHQKEISCNLHLTKVTYFQWTFLWSASDIFLTWSAACSPNILPTSCETLYLVLNSTSHINLREAKREDSRGRHGNCSKILYTNTFFQSLLKPIQHWVHSENTEQLKMYKIERTRYTRNRKYSFI